MRWKVALALVPVLYVPACVATHAFEVWRAKTPVASAPAGEFPLLQRKGNVLQIVRYNARDSHATYLVPPSAQQQLDAQHKPDDPDQIYAQVDFESLRSGLQRVHVKTAHELAMGYIRTESWYDTDGKSIVPRFEREYLPTWMLLWACALAVPVAVIAATAAAPVVRRWNAPPAAAARAAIAAILFVVAAIQLGEPKTYDAVALPILAAAAYFSVPIKWTRRAQAIAIIAAAALPIAIVFFSSDIAASVVVCEVLLVALTAAAALIERSLRYALTTAPTTS